MDDTVIKVENISKLYHLGSSDPYKTVRESIVNLFKKKLRFAGKKTPVDEKSVDLWALRDVSFEVQQGDIVGIIGRNGAGKSTLLKILSRITEPTSGRITMKGRVGSLLEVGTGFHPELSGHENVYLYGAILGMDRLEVTRKFDEIIAFADLEKFIETPVKRYSSGMYMRLAFAVAAHLDPDILLVDEVLAVGDAAFQQKCLGKMDEVSRGGRTVIFVSHNMSSILRLCTNAILLDNGKIVSSGPTAQITELYLKSGMAAALQWERTKKPSADAYFTKVFMRGTDKNEARYVTTSDSPSVTMEFAILRHCRDLQLTVDLLDSLGEVIVASFPLDANVAVPNEPGDYQATITFPREILLQKTYCIKTVLWLSNPLVLLDRIDTIRFSVQETNSFTCQTPGKRPGLIGVRCNWTIEPRR